MYLCFSLFAFVLLVEGKCGLILLLSHVSPVLFDYKTKVKYILFVFELTFLPAHVQLY